MCATFFVDNLYKKWGAFREEVVKFLESVFSAYLVPLELLLFLRVVISYWSNDEGRLEEIIGISCEKPHRKFLDIFA